MQILFISNNLVCKMPLVHLLDEKLEFHTANILFARIVDVCLLSKLRNKNWLQLIAFIGGRQLLPRFSYRPVCKQQVSKRGILTFKTVPSFLFFLDFNKVQILRFQIK